MGLVLWIDENEFSTSLIEKVYKKRGLPFYGLGSVQDFAYLVEDLRPQVIALDVQTALKGLGDLKRQFETIKNTPVIFLGSDAQLDFMTNKIAELKKPLDPFTVSSQIEKILTELN